MAMNLFPSKYQCSEFFLARPDAFSLRPQPLSRTLARLLRLLLGLRSRRFLGAFSHPCIVFWRAATRRCIGR